MAKSFNLHDYLTNNKIELGSIKKAIGETVYKGGHNDIRKTKYDANIIDGKLDLYTHTEILTEGTKHPTRDEAESLVEWTNYVSQVYLANAPIVKKAFEKSENIRLSVWNEIFGDKSPWSVKRKGKKLIVAWDKEKAIKLGI